MSLKDRLIRMVRTAAAWSLPAKLLVSALLSALGGAGVLSYLVEYATYSYAMAYGFRPPVEGIPYLRTTVVAGSVFLLVSGAVIASALLFSLRRVVKTTFQKAHLIGKLMTKFRASGNAKAALIALGVAIPFGVLGFLLAPKLCGLQPISGCENLPFERWIIASSFSFAVTLLMLVIRSPAAVWWFVVGYTFVYYAVVVVWIFTPSSYATFLRATGFGGGVLVVLQVEDERGKDIPAERSAFLMLRTASVFVVFDPTQERFEEYPIERVRRLVYASGGMHRLPHKLP